MRCQGLETSWGFCSCVPGSVMGVMPAVPWARGRTTFTRLWHAVVWRGLEVLRAAKMGCKAVSRLPTISLLSCSTLLPLHLSYSPLFFSLLGMCPYISYLLHAVPSPNFTVALFHPLHASWTACSIFVPRSLSAMPCQRRRPPLCSRQ